MYLSLSHALHSLRNPHLSQGSHVHLLGRKKKQAANPSEQVYEVELLDRLSLLQSIEEQGCLSLSWLRDALKVVLFTCTQVSNVLPKINCTDKEKVLLEGNLEDTHRLLDVCNGLKEVLHDVQHYVMLVRYASRMAMDLKDGSEEDMLSKLSLLHCALRKSTDFLHARVEENSRHEAGRSKLETCSSMLRRMADPGNTVNLSGKRASSDAIFQDLDAAKMLAIFVCGVLAIALSVKPKRPLSSLPIPDQPDWLSSLQTLQQKVKKLTDNGIQHGQFSFLKELDDLHNQTEELTSMLNNKQQDDALISESNRVSISRLCEKLSKDSDELQGGLLDLDQHLDGLFRMLVSDSYEGSLFFNTQDL